MATDTYLTMHRVVVIDDYEPSLHMYSMVIERMLGGEVVAFSDPREALHYMSGVTPTLLVLDQNMPDMDGVQVVRAVRNSPATRSVPVIMLTGVADQALKARALEAGVNAFLSKPIGAEEFAQYVKRLSAGSRVRIPSPSRDEETIELRVRAEGADKRVNERDRLALWALFRAYEARDPQAANRARLATEIAVLLAIECRCSTNEVQLLRDAGFVYDIGKLSIPEKIFTSPTALSAQARAQVQKHCEIGAAILSVDGSTLFAGAARLAMEHHERYDGDGYPKKLKREGISMTARVMAVADAFIAMLHKRADRPPMPFGHALAQIKRETGTHFDPAVVAALEKIQPRVAELVRGPVSS